MRLTPHYYCSRRRACIRSVLAVDGLVETITALLPPSNLLRNVARICLARASRNYRFETLVQDLKRILFAVNLVRFPVLPFNEE